MTSPVSTLVSGTRGLSFLVAVAFSVRAKSLASLRGESVIQKDHKKRGTYSPRLYLLLQRGNILSCSLHSTLNGGKNRFDSVESCVSPGTLVHSRHVCTQLHLVADPTKSFGNCRKIRLRHNNEERCRDGVSTGLTLSTSRCGRGRRKKTRASRVCCCRKRGRVPHLCHAFT